MMTLSKAEGSFVYVAVHFAFRIPRFSAVLSFHCLTIQPFPLSYRFQNAQSMVRVSSDCCLMILLMGAVGEFGVEFKGLKFMNVKSIKTCLVFFDHIHLTTKHLFVSCTPR